MDKNIQEQNAMKFRQKPIAIDAIRFTDETATEIVTWANHRIAHRVDLQGSYLSVSTLKGDRLIADLGDWIIKDINGEFYPCKPDIFEKTYEAAQSSNTSDIEIEEDLVKELDDMKWAFVKEINSNSSTVYAVWEWANDAADGCIKIAESYAQSFADKQCQEFAEWIADNEYELIQGCYVKACARKATTTAELLTRYKQSK